MVADIMNYQKTAELLYLLSSPKRLQILDLLNRNVEMSVGVVAKEMGIRKANVSQQIGILRMNRLVKLRIEGKYSYYRLSPGTKEILTAIQRI